MTTDVAVKETSGTWVLPEVRRLRLDAERVGEAAGAHRGLAVELETGNDPDGLHRGRHQRWLAEVADCHAMAYQELAAAAEARGEARRYPRHTPQWTRLVEESFAAIRRAEAHHERAAAQSARAAGDEAAARRRETAAAEADRRASAPAKRSA
ncbi:hypothetical protein SAMN05421837_101436 [Amycolatopsis pretoriensis]|uniref:Uncharacterized protein n=1 Tax=Amycolatopsis pretoriensis TaxID=218821 RepID=A0A1H5Q3F5_9PSEU|nr:hypothetical protein [Amycolatopsis pretoriensis]SEF20606.1 hypothetical protein SAMN05421837_101436 [Amycolatopsis pretoriensis]